MPPSFLLRTMEMHSDTMLINTRNARAPKHALISPRKASITETTQLPVIRDGMPYSYRMTEVTANDNLFTPLVKLRNKASRFIRSLHIPRITVNDETAITLSILAMAGISVITALVIG
jgi:hypothetical protein